MKVATVGNGCVNVNDREIPEPESGGIIVRMYACGVCGSDLEKVYGSYAKPSMRLGHEPSGIISKIGNEVDEFSVGDRVFTHHHVACGVCRYCLRDKHTLCAKYSSTNLDPCGLSEYYAVSAHNVSRGGVLKLPDSVSFEQAALIEPLACCLRSLNSVKCSSGDHVAVLGCGPTGIMHLMYGISLGLKMICTDSNDFRLDFARSLGDVKAVKIEDGVKSVSEFTDGHGCDVVIVANGSMNAIHDALDMVRNGGTVLLFGVPSMGAMLEIDAGALYSHGVSIVSSYAATDEDTKLALYMIESGLIDVSKLVTHRYSLKDTDEAFKLARSGDKSMKVIVTSGEF